MAVFVLVVDSHKVSADLLFWGVDRKAAGDL
jgi:hypothetical protein